MSIHLNCEGVSRRDSLRLGLGGLLAGGLAGALRARAGERSGGLGVERQADSCILIWMDGGPSHYETFDPKPEAPVEIRGQFAAIPTKTPGMQFSQPMKRLASISNHLAVVRSIRHDQGNHGAGNHYMMTGSAPRIPVGCGAFVSFHPSLGSVRCSPTRRAARYPCLFFNAVDVALRWAQFSGCKVRAIRCIRQSTEQQFSGS